VEITKTSAYSQNLFIESCDCQKGFVLITTVALSAIFLLVGVYALLLQRGFLAPVSPINSSSLLLPCVSIGFSVSLLFTDFLFIHFTSEIKVTTQSEEIEEVDTRSELEKQQIEKIKNGAKFKSALAYARSHMSKNQYWPIDIFGYLFLVVKKPSGEETILSPYTNYEESKIKVAQLEKVGYLNAYEVYLNYYLSNEEITRCEKAHGKAFSLIRASLSNNQYFPYSLLSGEIVILSVMDDKLQKIYLRTEEKYSSEIQKLEERGISSLPNEKITPLLIDLEALECYLTAEEIDLIEEKENDELNFLYKQLIKIQKKYYIRTFDSNEVLIAFTRSDTIQKIYLRNSIKLTEEEDKLLSEGYSLLDLSECADNGCESGYSSEEGSDL